jgi:hypothetical protein
LGSKGVQGFCRVRKSVQKGERLLSAVGVRVCLVFKTR